MTRERQKEREQNAVRAFLGCVGVRASSIEDGERPDTRVVVDGVGIGVEVTETQDSTLAQAMGSAPRIALRLEKSLIARGVFVDLLLLPMRNHGGFESIPTKPRRQAEATLLNLVSKIHTEIKESAEPSWTEHLIPRVEGVSVIEPRARVSGLRALVVTVRDDLRTAVHLGAASMRLGSAHRNIEEIVRSKDNLVATYRTSTELRLQWLILHVDGSFASQYLEQDLTDVTVESAFDAVGIVGTYPLSWGRWLKRPLLGFAK